MAEYLIGRWTVLGSAALGIRSEALTLAKRKKDDLIVTYRDRQTPCTCNVETPKISRQGAYLYPENARATHRWRLDFGACTPSRCVWKRKNATVQWQRESNDALAAQHQSSPRARRRSTEEATARATAQMMALPAVATVTTKGLPLKKRVRKTKSCCCPCESEDVVTCYACPTTGTTDLQRLKIAHRRAMAKIWMQRQALDRFFVGRRHYKQWMLCQLTTPLFHCGYR